MLRALIITELKLAIRARRVWWVALAMLGLGLTAAMTGATTYQDRRAAHRSLMGFGEAQFADQKADHPHTIAHRGYVVSRPPPPLGFLDEGMDQAYGRWLRLDAHQTRILQGARTADLLRAPGGGRWDLGLLLGLIAPAFVIALGYDRISGDKSRGMFAMLRAAGLRPGLWAVAKVVGLAARVGLGIGLPAAALAIGLTAWLDPTQGWRLAAWLGVHAIGLGTWGAVVLVVSAATATPRRSLGAGLLVWGFSALVVPPAASAMARVLAPPPPPAALSAKLATWAQSAHAQTESLHARALEEIRRRHPDWDGEGDPPEVVDAVVLQLADRDIAAQMRALLGEVAREQDREADLAAAMSFASPSGLTQLASSAVAGSDLNHARYASAHFEAYRQRLMTWINTWWAQNGRGGFEEYDYEKSLGDLSKAPRPTDPELSPSLAWVGGSLPCLLCLILGLLSVGIFGGLCRRQVGV